MTDNSKIQGVERRDLKISNVNKFFKVKKNRKFSGRAKVARGRKSSGVGGGSRRRFNFKTQLARKILATRHGISRATKKTDNKFVMRYGEVAKLMRRNGYLFDRNSGKWLNSKDKKDKKDKKTTDDQSSGSPAITPQQPEPVNTDSKDVDNTVKDTQTLLTDTPIKAMASKGKTALDLFVGNTKQKAAKDENESPKSLQARLFLYTKGIENALIFTEKDGEMVPTVSPSDVISYVKNENGLIWNEEYQVWTTAEHAFAFTNNTFGENSKSILARTILANDGLLTSLDLYEVGKSDLYAKMLELGYTWDNDNSKWLVPAKENISKRTLPEPVVINTINK